MYFLPAIQHALCNPGPDLVVCDEGHRIKNDYSNISQALKTIRTKYVAIETNFLLTITMSSFCYKKIISPLVKLCGMDQHTGGYKVIFLVLLLWCAGVE